MKTIELVPVNQIRVLNPRDRNEQIYGEIVENIAKIGLKRPITVTRRSGPGASIGYDLVCGEGRLEAYQRLGLTEIPAVVIEAAESDCMVMSLVENIARRQRPTIELMNDIRSLMDRGYNEAQIGRKLGVTTSWTSMIAGLIAKGEEKLLVAVDRGLIPVSLAATIAQSDDAGLQEALAEAYTKGVVRGRKLVILKKLLDNRASHGRNHAVSPANSKPEKKLTPERLLQIYQKEVGKLHILIKKADFTQKRLLFVIQALQSLLQDDAFVEMLHSEGIDSLPKTLEMRMRRGHLT